MNLSRLTGPAVVAALASALIAPTSALATARPGAASAPTPSYGGTLNVLGNGDTDYLDPNITYYTTGYAFTREFSRQLYTWPAAPGKTTTVVPDLATAAPVISNGGRTYQITIRTGAKWNTTPASQVTGQDVQRGIKATCNPAQPSGALVDFETLIAGMTKFCDNFERVAITAKAMSNYMENHQISGVTVDPDNPQTVYITLTHPAGYFLSMLAMPAFSPRPVQLDKYVPASADMAQHTISDGPYTISSYTPAHKLTFVRNPAWDSSTDSIRSAYVDKIKITMLDDPTQSQQELESGTANADLCTCSVPTARARKLHAKHDPRLALSDSYEANPFLMFNTRSPRNKKLLRYPKLRRAISYALNRNKLVAGLGGPAIAPKLTHVLPSGIDGSRNFNDYPHKLKKARALIHQIRKHHPKLKKITVRYLYRPASPNDTHVAKTVRANLKRVGIKVKLVGVPDADYYFYLADPSEARRGTWDMAASGWLPDWYGDAALSFFKPLLDGRQLPPTSYDYGLFKDRTLDGLIDKAAVASRPASDKMWARADRRAMLEAAIYPVASLRWPTFRAAQVHNAVFLPATLQFDYTNVWLDPATNGG
jgi:peptide/nickel transport system substrate-binding protein